MRRALVLVMLAAAMAGSPIAFAAPRMSDSTGATPSYATVKKAIAKLFRRTYSDRKKLLCYDSICTAAGIGSGSYQLENCQLGSDFVGDHNAVEKITRVGIYASVANEANIWEADLRALGYPAFVWQLWVARYEASAISFADKVPPARFYEEWHPPELQGLQTKLEAYWRSHRYLAKTTARALGCGAGEQMFKLATQPRGAQVLVIPSFFYELCQVQRINADDTSRCRHWREVLDGTISTVSGDYHYRARWPDGTMRVGSLSFDHVRGDTLTLRKR